MRPIRADRCRHDDGERGADAELHAYGIRHGEDVEHLVKDGHDDGAAANAEDPGEQAGDDPGGRGRSGKPSELDG